jgi:hypothetical protein
MSTPPDDVMSFLARHNEKDVLVYASIARELAAGTCTPHGTGKPVSIFRSVDARKVDADANDRLWGSAS